MATLSGITIEVVARRRTQSALHVVRRNGEQIGLVERFPARKGEEHPYKAFSGKGETTLAVFYPSEVGSIEAYNLAIQAVAEAD